MSSKIQLEEMMHQEQPYMELFAEEVHDCLVNDDCSKIKELLKVDGKLKLTSCLNKTFSIIAVMSEKSYHPVHLTKGSSFAFIPYCGFSTSFKELSKDPGSSGEFFTCDKFEPVLLEGELCYQLNISEHIQNTISFGPRNGLLLVVDNNLDKSVHVSTTDDQATDKTRFKVGGGEASPPARVYIHTLAGHWALTPGLHSMTAVKEVTGTPSFLALTQEQRGGCQQEEREECQTEVCCVHTV